MVTITCEIPELLDAKLDEAASHRRIPKSQFVVQCLEQAVPVVKNLGMSLADKMRDACGMVESGVPDLSTNPKHMEGYGKD